MPIKIKNNDFILILPDIRSCHNVGAMFRTADACGVTKIYLTGYTPCPPRPQIDKVALGAETWVPWEKKKSLKMLVKLLKKRGVAIIGLEKNNRSRNIANLSFTSQVALIVGNEVDGIRPDILDLCDFVAHIPMYGRKESLNVSIAAGIAMYEMKRNMVACTF